MLSSQEDEEGLAPVRLAGGAVLLVHSAWGVSAHYVQDVSSVEWAVTRPLAYFLTGRKLPPYLFTADSTAVEELSPEHVSSSPERKLWLAWLEFFKKALPTPATHAILTLLKALGIWIETEQA